MALNREAAAQAIFDRLVSLCGANFLTYSREYSDPTQLQPEQQPALMLIAERYNKAKSTLRGTPNVWLLYFNVLLYLKLDPTVASPETAMNALINAVEDALRRLPTEPITDQSNPTDTNLGGIVERVSVGGSWVSSTGILLAQGSASGQSAAIIPIEVLMSERSTLGGG